MTSRPTNTDWRIFSEVQKLTSAGKVKALSYILKLIDKQETEAEHERKNPNKL